MSQPATNPNAPAQADAGSAAAAAGEPATNADSPEARRRRAVVALLLIAALAIFGVAAWRAGVGDWIMVRRWVKRLADRDPDVRSAAAGLLIEFGSAQGGSTDGAGRRAAGRRQRVVDAVEPVLESVNDDAFAAACGVLDTLDPGGDSPAGAPIPRLRRHMLEFSAAKPTERAALVRALPTHRAAPAHQLSAAFNAALSDPVSAVRREAAMALLKWHDPAAAALRRTLRHDPDKRIRELAADHAAATADKAAGPMLALAAVSDEPEVRRAALAALAQIDPESGRRAAMAQIESDRLDLRRASAYLLGFTDAATSLRALEQAAENRVNPDVLRAIALAGLCRAESIDASERRRTIARELLASKDREARGWAAWATGRMGGAAAGAELLKRVEQADRFAVDGPEIAILRMLGELNHRPAAAKLERIAGAGFKSNGETHAGRTQRSSPTALTALFAVDPARAARTAAERMAQVPPARPVKPGARSMAEISVDQEDLDARAAVWAAFELGRSGRLKSPAGISVLLDKRDELSDRAAALEVIALVVAGESRDALKHRARLAALPTNTRPPEAEAALMLLDGTATVAEVRSRVQSTAWDFVLGWTVLWASPATRRGAWDMLLSDTTAEVVDRRLRQWGLDRELRAEFPDMPRREYFADEPVRLFQCRVLIAWWRSKSP